MNTTIRRSNQKSKSRRFTVRGPRSFRSQKSVVLCFHRSRSGRGARRLKPQPSRWRTSDFDPVAQTAPDSESGYRRLPIGKPSEYPRHAKTFRLSPPLSASLRLLPLHPPPTCSAVLCSGIVQFWQNFLCTCKMPFHCLWLRLCRAGPLKVVGRSSGDSAG